jgi:ribokinase
LGEPLDIVGLGLAIVDVVLRVERMPTWDDPRGLEDFTLTNGGPAGTACFVASSLGLATGFVDTTGTDSLAERRRGSLEEAGVDTSRMVEREGPEDHVVVVWVNAATGERTFSFRRGFLAQPLSPAELDRQYITSAGILHLDGSHHEAALAAARWMHESGGVVVMDGSSTDKPIPDAIRRLVSETDYLICGSGFGQQLTGETDLWRSGRAMLELGPRVAVQTEGRNGCYTTSRGQQFHTPAFEVEVIDTTGAGDVFHGAYLVGLVKRWELQRIAAFASAVAALHCTVLGNRQGIPSMAEAEALMAGRGAAVQS